jgi:metal-sulfur cluster biosynthetic enzyme
VEDAIRELPEEVRKSVMELLHRTDDPVILADIVSQQFIHDIEMRQNLLEMQSPAARIAWLCQALEK